MPRAAYRGTRSRNRASLSPASGARLCTACGACDDLCPHGVEPAGIIAKLAEGRR
jgi:succinate dehydrogenase/fumarate reductase-like Fe-S protein